jgi:hypothetical protein
LYHKRLIDKYLEEWKAEADRKPLLLRGARQVGKSSAVRQLALKFHDFMEVNFEETPKLKTLFASDVSPQRIVENLSIYFGKPVVPGQTLLFFDEIQACPEAISSLRFFYEKMPALHVIAAGSLLEFALQSLPSYGVGRVRSLFIYPFSFDEFLEGIGEDQLLKAKQNAGIKNPLPEILHFKLLEWLKIFMLTGGMPEAVARYADNRRLIDVQRILDDLYIAFKADFTKYKNNVPPARLVEVMESVVHQAGGKFKFNKASENANHGQIKEALELLIMAGLVLPVTHTAANGIPPGAEMDPKKRKMMLLDTGIFQRILGLNLVDFLFDPSGGLINKGVIAEQFWGLEFLKYRTPFIQPALYYWHRESPNANAEVDFVVQKGAEMLPIEVKASGQGSMQSLRQFLKEKNKTYGYRFSLENFSEYNDIKSFPLYAVSNFAHM